jgi:hypothetical protein
VRLALPAVLAAAFFSRFDDAIEDVAESAGAIRSQQMSLARWARSALPEGSRIGLNDAGAMAYLSGHATFDLVGLTTASEVEHWLAGPGSRFEHYERIRRSRLPTHFVVYREWFQLDPLLGAHLTERFVPERTILGGPLMVAHEADFGLLHTGSAPSSGAFGELADEVDVADVESERAHGYELFGATVQEDALSLVAGRADGMRTGRRREAFDIELVGGGALVVRWNVAEAGTADVFAIEKWRVSLRPGSWQEIAFAIPASVARRTVSVRVEATVPFDALHYWSFAPDERVARE